MIFLTNIDLSQNELQNAIIQPLAVAPASPKLGQIYCDSVSSKIMWYNGTAWKTIGVVVESSAVNGKIVVDGTEMTVYTLPTASESELGGIKVGAGLSVDAAGKLSVSAHNHDDRYYTEDEIDGKMAGKVDKVPGKALSTNDYTTAEKNKLAGIAAGAGVNVNADWEAVSGDAQILHKPTALSAFTNDEGFIDSAVTNLANYYLKTETYTQNEVNQLIGNIATVQIQVADTLPASGSSNIIYLVPKSPGTTANSYYEYIWVASSSSFEKVGDTEIDLSNYLQKTGDGSNVTAAFTAAGTRTLPASGDKLGSIIGKVVKYLTDLKGVAFSGSYNDLENKPALVKTAVLAISTAETTKSATLTGTSVLGVTVRDSVTNEVVLCDISINGMAVTVTVNAAPANALTAVISYL